MTYFVKYKPCFFVLFFLFPFIFFTGAILDFCKFQFFSDDHNVLRVTVFFKSPLYNPSLSQMTRVYVILLPLATEWSCDQPYRISCDHRRSRETSLYLISCWLTSYPIIQFWVWNYNLDYLKKSILKNRNLVWVSQKSLLWFVKNWDFVSYLLYCHVVEEE